MIANAFAALWGASAVDPVHPRDPGIVKMFGGSAQNKARVRVDGETVLSLPAVLRGVEILSNALMKVRPVIYRRIENGSEDDKERDRNHPNWRFITRRANPLMSAGFLRKQLTQWKTLHGNGLAALVRRGNGSIERAIPMLPDRSGMAIFRNGVKLPGDAAPHEDDEIWYWTVVGGELRKLRPENVLHIKGISNNGYWGLDLVDVLAETYGLAIAQRDYASTLFGKGALPAAVVFMPNGLKGDAQKDFAEKIKKAGEGLGKAHQFLMLEESAKVQQLSIDPEKAQMLEGRQFSIIEVANGIGIQPHKLGDSSRVAYNSLEQSNQEHLDDDLDPILQVWEDELEEKGLTEKEKENETHLIEFNRKSLVRVNLQARTLRDTFERTYGLATANDVLRRENQRPIGPVGDTFMVPANMTVLDPQGMPIIRGQVGPPEPQGVPQPRDDQNADRDAYHQLALHEVERLARRATSEAVRQAKQGGGPFLTFLDQLPTWTHKPAAVAPLLSSVAGRIQELLGQYANPPYVAGDLVENLTTGADAIIAHALTHARSELEISE